MTVLLRNDSDKALFWSSDCFPWDSSVWKVVFSGRDFKPPEPWGGSRPPTPWKGPVRLDPGQTATMTIPLAEAFRIWPRVAEGTYSVHVSYSPNRAGAATVRDGKWTNPYDVPGFWKGTATTPAVAIEVRHPPQKEKADADEGQDVDRKAVLDQSDPEAVAKGFWKAVADRDVERALLYCQPETRDEWRKHLAKGLPAGFPREPALEITVTEDGLRASAKITNFKPDRPYEMALKLEDGKWWALH